MRKRSSNRGERVKHSEQRTQLVSCLEGADFSHGYRFHLIGIQLKFWQIATLISAALMFPQRRHAPAGRLAEDAPNRTGARGRCIRFPSLNR